MVEPRSWNRNLTAALAAGAVLWTIGVYNRSLWIDEFHTLEHARGGDGLGVLGSLSSSNHPPLSFLLVSWTEQLFGDSHLALRWWSVVVGLLTVVVAARFARRLPAAGGRNAVPWLVVLSSFAFMIFTEVRMYGLMAVAVLGLVATVLATLEGRGRGWWTPLWIALGLYSHYYFVHYGFVLTLVTIAAAVARPEYRPGLRRLLLPVTVGLLLFLPWGLTGLVDQMSHDRSSGGSSGQYLNLVGFCQSIAHLLYMNASLGGEWVTMFVALPGALAGVILGALGIARLWLGRRDGLLLALLVTAGLVVPLWSFFVAVVYNRAGYNWRYIAGSCVPTLMLVAAGVGYKPVWRAAVSAVLFVTLGFVTLVNTFSPGQEDFRGCVRYILEHAAPEDAVLLPQLREVNPAIAPTGWDYYRKHLALSDGAKDPRAYRFADADAALQHDRVWTYIRYRFPERILEQLAMRFSRHEVVRMGNVMTVHLYAR